MRPKRPSAFILLPQLPSSAMRLHRTPATPSAHARPLRAWVWLLACAVALSQLLMPTLGAMHQVLHHASLSPTPAAWAAQRAGEAEATSATDANANAGIETPTLRTAGHLFDGHSAADCLAFDQVALGIGVWAQVWQWASSPPERHASWTLRAWVLRSSAALYWARGPPAAQG